MEEKKDILNDSEEALEKSESAEEKAEALLSEDAEAFSENQEDKTEYGHTVFLRCYLGIHAEQVRCFP